MYKSRFTKKSNVLFPTSPSPTTHKNHQFQKGHRIVLFLLKLCLKILHFISFTYLEKSPKVPYLKLAIFSVQNRLSPAI